MKRLLLSLLLITMIPVAFANVGALKNPKMWEDLLDLLETVSKAVEDDDRANKIDKDLKGLKNEIKTALEWTGTKGYLLEARAFTDINGKVRHVSEPLKYGMGSSPANALAVKTSSPQLRYEAKDGLQFSAKDSYFVWATIPQGIFRVFKPKVSFGIVPGRLATELRREAAKYKSNKMVMAEIRKSEHNEQLRGLVETAKKKLSDASKQKTLQDNLDKYDKIIEEKARISADLKAKLAAAQRGNQKLQQLSLIGNILSVASASYTLYSELGLSPPSNETNLPLDNNEAVKNWLTNFSQKNQLEISSLEKAQQQVINIERTTNIIIIDLLEGAGAPSELIPNRNLY